MLSLNIARTAEAAERAARWIRGDAISEVVEASDLPRLANRADTYTEIFVEGAFDNLDWLLDALRVARSLASAQTRIALVAPVGAMNPVAAEAIGEAIGGWTVEGLGVLGANVGIFIAPSSELVADAVAADSVKGALVLAEALNTLLDRSKSSYEDFEYRSSLLTSYLAEIPRLHRELEALRAPGRDSRVSALTGVAEGSARRASQVRTGVSYDGREERDSRRRRRVIAQALAGVLAWVLGATAVAISFELGASAFLTLVLAGAVVALSLDVRRRAIEAQRRTKQLSSSISRAEERIIATVSSSAAYGDTIHRTVLDTGQKLAQMGSRLHHMEDSIVALNDVISRVSVEMSRRTEEIHARLELLEDRLLAMRADDVKTLVNAVPSMADLRSLVSAELSTLYRQVDSLHRIRDLVGVTGPTPILRGWAASPDTIAVLLAEIKRLEPGLIVECGSGASTVWMAMACKSFGLPTRLVALEHDETYAKETRLLLEGCGVDQIAEVRLAPLEETAIGPFQGQWYSLVAVADLIDIGLLFVDGPPEPSGTRARYPALPLLANRLADVATVILDDIVREDEKEIARAWAEEFPEFELTEFLVEKGAAVFRRGSL